ncbi:MAG: hypothetical protein J0H18_16935 [Rhizobiales bacterium]|nr:hypothetical protein [Hyphomicrobiales bacterium]OJX99346.1 MAG: hypothetical protein BGP07_04745 [Rhizobiales bacterium 63-22]
MRPIRIILPAVLLSGFAAAVSMAHADAVPKRSKNFNPNYHELVKTQRASPQVAACIAAAYDYVKKSRKYDRLGFTKDDISRASVDNRSSKFSAKDPRRMSAVISVPGEARLKSVGYKWDGIMLRCGIAHGRLKAIELVQTKAAD